MIGLGAPRSNRRAVAIGLLAVPLSALGLASGSSAADPAVLMAASASAVASGLLAGVPLGRFLLRRRRRGGALAITCAVAWPAAILGAPVLPALLGAHGELAELCVETCAPPFAVGRSDDLVAALETLVTLLASAVIGAPALGAAVFGFALAGAFGVLILRRLGRPEPARSLERRVGDLAAALLGGLPWGLGVLAAPVPFALLAGGVVLWAGPSSVAAMRETLTDGSRRPEGGDEPSQPEDRAS